MRWLLALLPVSALAGPLDHIETAINAGHPEHVMTERGTEAWDRLYDPDGGILEFLEQRRSGDVALTRAWWVSPNAPYTQSSWLLMRFKGDLVDGFLWTDAAPPRGWQPGAPEGQAADVATTAIGLSQGFVEANPLVASAVVPVSVAKIGGTWLAQEYGSPETCRAVTRSFGPIGWGAAGWNAGILAGIGPAAIVPAIGIGVLMAKQSDPFWKCVPDELR